MVMVLDLMDLSRLRMYLTTRCNIKLLNVLLMMLLRWLVWVKLRMLRMLLEMMLVLQMNRRL